MSGGPKKWKRDTRPARNEFGSVSGPAEFQIKRILPGPIERVWSYLTDAEKRRKWFGGGPMELRTGGRVELQFHFSELTKEKTPPEKGESCEVPGRITRCEPPRLLGYTWGDGPEASEVTFELTEEGMDVLLVVTHRRIGDMEKMISVASGWHTHMDILADYLNGRIPKPFWATKGQMEEEYRKRLAG
jgi:uncharacterized protein YndB with AHSA1/START domain